MPVSLSSQCSGKESAGTPPLVYLNRFLLPCFWPTRRMSEAGGSAASLASPAAPGDGRERPLALHPGVHPGAPAAPVPRSARSRPPPSLGPPGACTEPAEPVQEAAALCGRLGGCRCPPAPSPAQPILTQLILSQPSRAQSLPCGTAGGTRRAWDARAPEGGSRGRRCQVCGWSPAGICGQSWTRPRHPGHSTGPSGSCAMPPSSPLSDSLRYGESPRCVGEPVSAAERLPGGLQSLLLES